MLQPGSLGRTRTIFWQIITPAAQHGPPVSDISRIIITATFSEFYLQGEGYFETTSGVLMWLLEAFSLLFIYGLLLMFLIILL